MGFGCACDYVAKIASSRFPREKNRPRTQKIVELARNIVRFQDKSTHQIDNQINEQPKKSKSKMKAEQLARAKAWHDARTNKAKGGAAVKKGSCIPSSG